MNQDFMNVNSWQEEDKNEDVEIDLVEIWQVIKKQFGLLVIIVILCAVLAGVISKFFIAPKYTSSSTIFLTPSISETGVVDYTSQNSNEKLVNNVMALLVQDNILSEVAKQTGMESVEDLRNQIKVSNDTNTTLVKVEATTLDPKLSKNIVNSTVNVFIDTMQENLNLKNIEIVDKAKLSYEPSGPNVKKNILMGAAAGFVMDALIVVLKVLTNTKLKSKEEAEKYLKLPVFCELPVIKD
ncbi:MAG: Wzz/FepE/Etk N-terminal domain-containing protein [Floccifex porci]|uniref:YveK family protein n=1 Tax=Floccifex porci TaxID=2606629 RepID=UPI0023F04CD7|nr:Wzz/FepE/Etk N-terminal domain-containing protein [Floccifex porci]MDD7466752.1 Wzz/FepE/Etk N-terminal domain-containing protein [Floccifex porci]